MHGHARTIPGAVTGTAADDRIACRLMDKSLASDTALHLWLTWFQSHALLCVIHLAHRRRSLAEMKKRKLAKLKDVVVIPSNEMI